MKLLFSALSLCLALGISGCTELVKPVAVNEAAAPSPRVVAANLHPEDEHDAPRISLADAKKDFDEKAAVFIDTHPPNQFELEHIPGAINLQANTIKQNLDKVPKGKKIIAYCS